MVRYYCEDTDFVLKHKRVISSWIRDAILEEGKKPGDINVIFCSDPYLLDINIKYLQHNYYTDIITFDYCQGDIISGDLFISVDTVKDNSSFYKTEFIDEIHRVIIHGVLHLLQYDDHTEHDQMTMRSKEDYYLAKLNIVDGDL